MKAPEDPPEDVQLASTLCVLAGKKQFQVLPEFYQQRYLRMARAARRACDADAKELKRLREECADVGAQAVHDAQTLMETFQLLGQYERDPETAQKRMRKGDMYERLVNVLSGVLTTLGVPFTPNEAGIYEGLLTVVSRLKRAERSLQAATASGDAALCYLSTEGVVRVPERIRQVLGLPGGGGVMFFERDGHVEMMSDERFAATLEPDGGEKGNEEA